MAPVPRIGIDAMGGDHGPSVIVDGTIAALREMPGRFEIVLVGDEKELHPALQKAGGKAFPVEVVHAPERIDMAEKAAAAVRRKTASSLGVMTRLHKEGKLDAIFSAGNTGAVVAAALLGLGRLEGVSRPALAAILPNVGAGTVVLDVGANADVKASYLVQFAHMGAVFARYLMGRENPRVGLLSIGEEDSKGNALVLETVPLMRQATHLNFVGNIEGRDLFAGTCDVAVTDGFTGNVVLKTAESVAGLITNFVREEVSKDWVSTLGAVLMKPAMRRLKARIDWEEYGAAPLLGVNGVCFVGHGKSRTKAIKNAIRTVTTFVDQRVNEHIHDEIAADRTSAA